MRKSSLWKTSRWNARLIHTINKNNNKNNNKNQDRITKAFEQVLVGETTLSIISLKYFFCTCLTILLPLTFSNFFDSNNPSILWSLRLLLPKASASAFYCFQIVKKNSRQFKILPILYFYHFIIIFNLILQQVLLVIELKEVRNFCQQISGFSIPFIFENISQKFVMRKEHSTIFICSKHIVFFSGKFYKLKA